MTANCIVLSLLSKRPLPEENDDMTDFLSSALPFNPELEPVFLSGYPGPSAADRAERLAARQDFCVSDTEKAFAVLCAEVLQMKFNQEIFTGHIPENIRDGCVTALLPDEPGKDCNYWNGRLSFSLRFRQREKLLQLCSRLLTVLPLVKWLSVTSALQQKPVVFCRVAVESVSPVAGVNGAGLHGYSTEIIFKLQICITPPAPEII